MVVSVDQNSPRRQYIGLVVVNLQCITRNMLAKTLTITNFKNLILCQAVCQLAVNLYYPQVAKNIAAALCCAYTRPQMKPCHFTQFNVSEGLHLEGEVSLFP